MARKKRRRFAEVKSLSNCFDRDDVGPGGQWVRDFFGGDRPLILELGCGKAEYTLALADRFPGHDIVGIDRRSDRFWRAAREALSHSISNVAFLRADIADLGLYFDEGQVDTLWIPFPDPRPKRRQAKHRILGRPFLAMYRRILAPDGEVHVKTDDSDTVEFLLDEIAAAGGQVKVENRDIHQTRGGDELLDVATTFEKRHLERGRNIQYVSFTWRSGPGDSGELQAAGRGRS